MIPATVLRPRATNADASGAVGSISRNGTIPVSTAATRMYSSVQMKSDPRMPSGKSRAGSLTSSAAVETASKPMYAKKI